MRKIVLNEANLGVEEIECRKKKARALIIDDNNVVTLCNYCNVYLLPGGKVEDNESVIEGLLRELEEELGLGFDKEELKELVSVVTVASGYPVRDSSKRVNRACETDYYIIRSNRKIDSSRVKLTDSELKCNFRIEYVPLDRVMELACNNEYRSSRNKYFVKELLMVLREFLGNNSKGYCSCDDEGLIDLHIHTLASDGDRSANDIIEESNRMGAQAISITDHDTIDGYRNLSYDRDLIKVIPGIELSAFSDIGRIHILGYGFDLENKALNEKLLEFHENSVNKIMLLADILKRNYGIKFDDRDIYELISLDKNIGRPDLAKLLMKYGFVKSTKEAFDKYLSEAHDYIRDLIKKPSYEECFDIIKNAGGVPVLAHPHTMLLDDNSLYYEILEMKKKGLMGIEAYHSNMPKELSDMVIKIAMEQELYLTGGSDYHGPIVKPDINLFTGRNNNIRVKKLNFLNDVNYL